MKTGFSIYLSSGIEKNEEVIHKAKMAGATYGFTSLHIPEEDYGDYKTNVVELLSLTKKSGIDLMVDVDGDTPKRLGLRGMEDLLDYGVNSIRLDFGFTDKDVVTLSKHFNIVWNASTTAPADIKKWEALGADIYRFTACHNYYPKPYTGLELSRVGDINERLKIAGYRISAFIPSDGEFRGPIFKGLPTVEEHRTRNTQVALNMLELYKAETDIVMLGDIDLSEKGWSELRQLSDGVIKLRAKLDDEYKDLYGKVFHDRPDSSGYVIRAEESRGFFADKAISPKNTAACETGSVCIGNDIYLRYKGELEICRKARPEDEKVNVIGKVVPEDLVYLPFIERGMGFSFVEE